jgi:D-beta-D-heptose 7-phosphate kinase/D-beta-D-heptose 1-phosphate adenosyltransferase
MRRAHVLVAGDLIVDEYVSGAAHRLSPEAPVPVVDVEKKSVFPGGAANVALNASRLGAHTILVGVVGDDADGEHLRELLADEKRLETVLIVDPSRPTTKKTRVVASGHQIVRFDHEVRRPLSPEIAARAISEIKARFSPELSALVLSDYQKGVLCPSVLRAAIDEANAHRVPCVVDPKLRDFSAYRGATVVTPNLAEACAAADAEPGTPIRSLLSTLRSRLEGTAVVITEGEGGMTLQSADGDPVHLPAHLRRVFDLTGAGDTVLAVLSAALAAGATLLEAAELANVAAGIAVSKPGIATVEPDEILHDFDD